MTPISVLDGDFIADLSERAAAIMNQEAGDERYSARPIKPHYKRVIHTDAGAGDEAIRMLHRAAYHKGSRIGRRVGVYQHPDGQSFCVVG